MRVVYFTHSLASCWNHGNAHFLRGVLRELIRRGHSVRVYEPEGAWSLGNLLADHGEAALAAFHAAYPELGSTRYGARFSPAEAVRHTQSILSALGAAHAIGIVHRDVKPDNVMLVVHPEGLVLKVLDFGMARVLPSAGERAPLPLSFPTDTGVVVGTPRFASPEAVRGKAIDARGDLYSVGLVLYAMLAGRGPFDHLDGIQSLLSAQTDQVPPPPSPDTTG